VKRKKLFFSLIAVIICAVLVGGAVAALTFMSLPSISSPKTTVELQIPLPKDCITAQQAIQIAKNYTNQYAKENNRTIVDIKAVFGYSSICYIYWNHFDCSPSKSDIPNENKTYCVWNVTAAFQETAPKSFVSDGQPVLEYTVPSFLVSIYGYSGQIKSQGPIITVNQQSLYDNFQLMVNQGQDLLPGSYVSAEQAIQMATPYVNQYASENNRTVLGMEAVLAMIQTERGSDGYAYYPIWSVEAHFGERPPPGNYWIEGYNVSIWADTAQLRSNNQQGIFQ
jgi:hypothetical protein